MNATDGLISVVTCARCGGSSADITLTACPHDGAVLGEVRMTPAEFNRGHLFGSHA
jgi:hypothetical protein